jgi:mono/diheme cytochrome c family protein
MSKSRLSAIAVTALAFAVPPADAASSAQRTLFESYQAIAKGDAVRGKAFFFASHDGGKPESPSCVTCHTTNLAGPGKTRAGKTIEPMAASVSLSRFTDRAEVEKWFRRNCSDVLGRECSAQEKSDILAFLLSI